MFEKCLITRRIVLDLKICIFPSRLQINRKSNIKRDRSPARKRLGPLKPTSISYGLHTIFKGTSIVSSK